MVVVIVGPSLISVQVVREIFAGTKVIADPETCFQELISDKSLNLLRDRPCLEFSLIPSNFQALLFLHHKLLESV